MFVYRLTLTKYVDTAFSGEGPRRVGSRWSPAGYPIVYTASSIALAVLETLVHVDPSVMPTHHVIAVEVPDAVSRTIVDTADLPPDWRRPPAPFELQAIGRSWLDAGETAILQVPSVVVPQEYNYALNPLHPDFKEFVISDAQPFRIDSRLLDLDR